MKFTATKDKNIGKGNKLDEKKPIEQKNIKDKKTE